MDSKPWHSVAWNPIQNKMIMGSDSIIQLLLLYLYDENILTVKELKTLKQGYASKLAYEGDDIENILETISN